MSEDAAPAYDPHARQPRTLGELERWAYADEASLHAAMARPPVSLNPPPIPGLDRLSAYCAAKYGANLSAESLRRLIGEYALAQRVSTDDAKAVALQEAAEVLAPLPPSRALTDREHALEFRALLDSWLPLRRAARASLHLLARFEPADDQTVQARAILAGLEQHGRPTARFVAGRTGSSESALLLWWVQSQLADNYTLDDQSAARFHEVRLVVDNALLQAEAAGDDERGFMEMAIQEARQSVGEDGRAHPKVGAVVVRDGKVLATAHRGEMGKGEHAEYTALEKKLENEVLVGATVYTTLEPCTNRNHPKVPCAERLIARRVKRVVIGMLDPNPTICGKGERLLRDRNIVVDRFPHDLIMELEELNRDFTRAQSRAGQVQPTSAPTTGQVGQAVTEPLRDAIQDLLFFSTHPDYQEAADRASAALKTIKAADVAPPGSARETWLHELKVGAFKLYSHITSGGIAPEQVRQLQESMKGRQDELWAMGPTPGRAQLESPAGSSSSAARTASAAAEATSPASAPTPTQAGREQPPQVPIVGPNPFRQLCALAEQIREQELERDRTPPHQRQNRALEDQAWLENRLRDLVADCCEAGRSLGEGREREAEEAAQQLAAACRALLGWESSVRRGLLPAEEAAPEKGGPCVALCNRLWPAYDRVDHLARLYERRAKDRPGPGAP